MLATLALLVAVAADPVLTRGPYLQLATPDQVTIRWRTDIAADSEVRYGLDTANLQWSAYDPAATKEHVVALVGLQPSTRYFYAILSGGKQLAGGDAEHYARTSPDPSSPPGPVRIWVIGDSGEGNSAARAVRDAYLAVEDDKRGTDVWLMLGDNAYDSGTDSEFQKAVFETYPSLLQRVPLWPTLGNHDAKSADSGSQSGVYYDIFTLPRSAEAGGLPSGTEAYYSFDFGNVHFICLDSEDSSRSPGGPMLTWLEADLQTTDLEWIIAYWHHPPYSKGSHDSDTGSKETDMREDVNPILEAYGVDLVFSGHSHSYERSWFINGHYGTSSSWKDSFKVQDGDGREDGDGAYWKPANANGGTIYNVNGVGAKTDSDSLDHPAMYYSVAKLGGVVLDVNGSIMEARFLRDTGAVEDHWTIVKGAITCNAESESLAGGDTLTVEIEHGDPGAAALLWYWDQDRFAVVSLGAFGGLGVFSESAKVPPGLSGSRVEFQAAGFAGGRIELSNRDAVTFR